MRRYRSWIVDRFHLSIRLCQLRVQKRDIDFTWLEERLIPLEFRIVFSARHPDTFEAARAGRLEISGKPGQQDDLAQCIEELALRRGGGRAARGCAPGRSFGVGGRQ